MSDTSSEDLTAAITSTVAKHPAYSTAEAITAATEKLIRLPEWKALAGPTKRHAWPQLLSYRSSDGKFHTSFNRDWIAGEVRLARQALTRNWD